MSRISPPFASAHLVGIGGSGMKSLAEILLDLNVRVTGSDLDDTRPSLKRLRAKGAEISTGHRAESLPNDVEAVIYSPAIPEDNAERQRAVELGLPRNSLPEALAQLMRERVGIAIAGTHGKSTTTAMVAWILEQAGRSPTAFIGAELCNSHRGGWAGEGEFFVVESCEYKLNFLHLQPTHAVILGIEPDHFETFPDETTLIDAFARFAEQLTPGGSLTVNGDCPRTVHAMQRASVPFQSFGLESTADWQVFSSQSILDIRHANAEVLEVGLPVPGRHNLLNAAAAAVVCLRVGLSAEDVANGLATFPGVARRFEIMGERNGVQWIDDYAHHPTAVRCTLETARSEFPDGRLWCVFQPHQTARVYKLMSEFAQALAIADSVRIVPAFSARESNDVKASACAEELAKLVASLEVDSRFLNSLDRILPSLDDESQPGDVVILMGAGNVDRLRDDFLFSPTSF